MGQIISVPGISPVTDGQPEAEHTLQVLECRVFRGPHLYSHTPMIRIHVDLGKLEELPSSALPGFTAGLLRLLPGLGEHTCSTGKVGGFVERLEEGTWLGHVIEHVAIELQTMAGLRVTRGKTRSVRGRPGQYYIMYAYGCAETGLYAGRLALELVASLLPEELRGFSGMGKVHRESEDGFDLEKGIAALRAIVEENCLGPTTRSLVEEAERRGIPWQRRDGQSLVQLGTGRYQKLIRASITSATSNIAVDMACDKQLTKKILSEVSIPVPEGRLVRTLRGAQEAVAEIGFPAVLKPLDGNHGRGVSTSLQSMEEVESAFARASEHASRVIVERHFHGNDYRVLVVKGEIVAVAERMPAHVVGNGTDSIAALIAQVNEDPRRGEGHEKVMTRIRVDDTLTEFLARSGLTLASVPARRQRVVLAATANLSTGGTAVDRTDDIHPDNACIARRAALAVGLDIAGIDMILPDITASWRKTGGGIVEVNAAPGFRMHLQPAEGKPRNVAGPVLSALFPPLQKTRVPVITITGTNGKSTTTRMTAHILRQSGLRVGFTSTSGIYVNDDCIWEGDASGPKSARLLMRDPTLDVAVLETARGGIVREGLGVQECDVGAVLNVTADHLGLGGIDTLEDLAAVKSVVAESVNREGVCVLNADDPHTLAMARHAGGHVCYFSMSGLLGEAVREHIAQGGRAVTREMVGGKAHIVLHMDGARLPVIAVDEIPATCGGAAAFNIENALAATAIASGLNVEPRVIRAALASFTSSYEQNPGRFNICDRHGFRVIMDYAHNPAALRAFLAMADTMRADYGRVIGHVSTPGDRRDEDIREMGFIAGTELDLIVFRERPDNRGRADGEVLRLLKEGALAAGCPEENIICVPGEEEASDICMRRARPGDLVLLMPSNVEASWQQILDFQPSPAPRELKLVGGQQAYA